MTSDRLKEMAFRHHKQAQKKLKKDGGVNCTAIAYDQNGVRLHDTIIDFDYDTRLQRLSFQYHVAQTNADVIVVVGEFWVSSFPTGTEPKFLPHDDPDRKEAIITQVITRSESFGIIQEFTKDYKNRKIHYGTLDVIQDSPLVSSFSDIVWDKSA